MAIKIGDKQFATRKPADLDTALVAATGCTPAEIAEQLRLGGYASHLARALHPFLSDKDAPSLSELARLIAAQDDPGSIRGDILKLYEPDDAKASQDSAKPSQAAA